MEKGVEAGHALDPGPGQLQGGGDGGEGGRGDVAHLFLHFPENLQQLGGVPAAFAQNRLEDCIQRIGLSLVR